MSKFKVGDRVKVKVDGTEATIAKACSPYSVTEYALKYEEGSVGFVLWTEDELELVEPAPGSADQMPRGGDADLESTTSQELVDIANKGFEALKVLRKRGDAELKFLKTSHCQWEGLGTIGEYKVRLKPKPVFEPYTIEGTGWRVEIDYRGTIPYRVHIGCEAFGFPALKQSLKDLLEDNMQKSGQHPTLYATKKGVLHHNILGYELLPWADAEILYEKIKEL